MKMIIESSELTEALESFSQDLILSAKNGAEIAENLPVLEGAAAFVSWMISDYCHTISNVAETEIMETLTQYKHCIGKTEGTSLKADSAKCKSNSLYGKSVIELIKNTQGITKTLLFEKYDENQRSHFNYTFYDLSDCRVICRFDSVISWSINKLKDNWILHITYFDEGAEQECSDSMIMCKVEGSSWDDDIKVLCDTSTELLQVFS